MPTAFSRSALLLLLASLLATPAHADGLLPFRPPPGQPGSSPFPGPNDQLFGLICNASISVLGDPGACTVPVDLLPTLVPGARDLIATAPSVLDQLGTLCPPGGALRGERCTSSIPSVFPDELAAQSWNLLVLLVSGSSDPTGGDGGLDPEDPFRASGCSYANPAGCLAVQQVLLGVPEPGTALGLGLGLALLGLGARRR